MNATTTIDECGRAAYRTWSNRQVTPAYVRGLPTWMWQSALCRRQRRRPTAT